MSHQFPAFAVQFLNDLNRSLPLLYAQMSRAPIGSESFDAMNAAHVAVMSERREYRLIVADDCQPWFDDSAFRPAHADIERSE